MRNRLISLVFAGLLFSPALAWQDDYLAYAVSESGEFPLPENVDDLGLSVAKHLVSFKWNNYTGSKARVTVLPVENESAATSYTVKINRSNGDYERSSGYSNQLVPIYGIESLITDALFQTGRFRVLERETMKDQHAEQDLGRSGRISKPSAAKIGKTLGSEVNIKLKVTNYDPNFVNKSIGGSGFGKDLLGGIGVGKKKSMVGIVFQLIDVETSEILFSKKVTAIVGKMGFSLSGSGKAAGGFYSSYAKTPIGQAVIACINLGTFELVKELGNKPASGVVISTDDGIAINIGANKQLQEGDRLIAKSKGKELIDPETGLSLGSRTRKIGEVEIVEVQEKFSFAEPVGFDIKRLKKGDRVFSTKKPTGMKFASRWTGPKGKKMDKKKNRNKRKYGQ